MKNKPKFDSHNKHMEANVEPPPGVSKDISNAVISGKYPTVSTDTLMNSSIDVQNPVT